MGLKKFGNLTGGNGGGGGVQFEILTKPDDEIFNAWFLNARQLK
jgi:hypothetical protein